MPLNSALFFSRVRTSPFGGKLTQPQVDGLSTILAYAVDHMPPDPRWLAYMLATTFHETAATMRPIEEYGRGSGRPYAASGCWGRGYVQLTWPYNYALWAKRLGVDLVRHPDLAMTPAVALPILFDGMTTGAFTGRKLADYFGPGRDDPVNARRIINGTDRAELVAGYHRAFLAALS